MDESTIAKSGELCVEEKRFLKTSWVKRFCVLYKKTTDSHGYMELYDDQEAFTQHKKKSKKCERRIELHNIKSIKSSSESSGKGNEYHIEIRSRFHKHNLMFRNERDFNDWFAMLQATADIAERGPGENSASYSGDIDDDYSDDGSDDEVITLNQMYASTDTAQRFEVEVEPSDLAKMCDIEGKMTLLVGNNDIAFEDPKTKRVKYSFQLAWMRRFGKYKTQSFNFEVGRKCPNGEGSVTCITPSAKLIHKTLTQKSASRSKLVIPHSHTEDETNCKEIKSSRPSVNSVKEKLEESPPPVKERQLPAVSQPVVPGGMVRKHPGKANTPSLIPIVRPTSGESESSNRPKSPPQPARRGSKSGKLRTSGKGSPTEEKLCPAEGNGHVRQTSYKAAVNSGEFTKELEQKLHLGNDDDSEKNLEHVKKDSVKTKEDKRREKEEKKEREKREKEEKKEKERKEKELEKERKLREKEEKKSGKKDKQRDSNKGQETAVENQRMMRERIYDEPEISPTPSSDVNDPNCIYDEATSPIPQNTPIEYAQSVKKKGHNSKTDNLYEDTDSVRPEKKLPEKVEYAEPYSKKGGIPLSQEPVMYADVKSVGKDAWKNFGRNEEEEVFEEDYSNIKSARESVQKQEPPPIPVKNYDDDEGENMYNTVDLKKPKSPTKAKPENIYGMASGKEVGELPTDIQVPEADYSSDSGESLPVESTYDDPQYEGYEAQAGLKKTSKNSKKPTKVVEAYEEAVVPVKPAPPKKLTVKVNSNDIYEEIS